MTTKNPTREEIKAAKESIAAFHEKLQAQHFDQQSKFDNALLLIAGGAFTVSTALVPRLDVELERPLWLIASWSFWGMSLILCMGGFLFSAYVNQRVMNLLRAEIYDVDLLTGGPAKLIPLFNYLGFLLLVLGLFSFGTFTFANLNFGDRNGTYCTEEGKQEGCEEEESTTRRGPRERDDLRERHTTSGAGIPQTQTAEELGDGDGRQEEATPATATAIARDVQASGRIEPSTASREQSQQRAESPTRLSETPEEIGN